MQIPMFVTDPEIITLDCMELREAHDRLFLRMAAMGDAADGILEEHALLVRIIKQRLTPELADEILVGIDPAAWRKHLAKI